MHTQYPANGPTAQEISAGYRQFVGDEVDLWHFAMMNDVARNTAFDVALGAAQLKGKVVLDIGTGSGLLAMMAVRHGAARVITCEAIPMIAQMATEIIKQNGYAEQIQVINKRSSELVVGKDLLARADVLVTEIFDDGLLAEGAFHAIPHAREHLLKPHAQIIPEGARVMAVAIESQEIFENHRVGRAAGFDVSAFNKFSLKGYTGYHLDKMSHRPLSAPKQVFDFDFENLAGSGSAPFEVEILDSGLCHAIAFWYELRVDGAASISTAPGLPKLSSWRQAVLPFDVPERLTKGECYRLTAHHDLDAIWFTRAGVR